MPLVFTLQSLLVICIWKFLHKRVYSGEAEKVAFTEKIQITMETAARKSGRGPLEGLYRVIMRRNSVYVTFIIVGAFLGERAVDYGVHKLWEKNNIGKRYEDIPVLGQRQPEE